MSLGNKNTRKAYLIILLFGLLYFSIFLVFIFSLSSDLFEDPYSTVLLDRNGEILGASIADDGQWRFPESENLHENYILCLTQFEDKRFYHHPGIDPIALARAFYLNIKHGKTVSGGSTLSMQTIRLSRKNKSRTYFEKVIEIFLALRLELKYSKDEILRLYASHAPFGGNVVGIEAASWRYFGRSPDNLSLAEYAMLAVLPNSPSLIHTGRNRDILKEKRDNLLYNLYQSGYIDKVEFELSVLEKIPEHPHPYPLHAFHLLNRAKRELSQDQLSKKIHSSIDIDLQKKVNFIVNRRNKTYSANGVNNIAAIIIKIDSGEVLAYTANASFFSDVDAKAIDMITAKRSTGSILKPFLYSAMLTEGQLLPSSMIADIPTRISGYMPENFEKTFDGAVNADVALTRSLNIPFVRMLQSYGVGKLINILRQVGLKSVDKSAEHYGLSLILGGAESSLWEVAGGYAGMARSLKYYTDNNSLYSNICYEPPNYLIQEESINTTTTNRPTSFLSAGAIYHCMNALTGVQRPEQESMWKYYSSRQPVAWKTGTSFGYKDAWTVGLTPDYVVGVWVGNASGEPKPNIVGIRLAAPVFFEIINILPQYKSWFSVPYDDLVKTSICKISGYLAGNNCKQIDSIYIPASGLNYKICPYHKLYHLDKTGTYRVNSQCYPISDMQRASIFVLPPAMEYYYRLKNPHYKGIPPFLEGCYEQSRDRSTEVMEIIYPNNLASIYIPVDITGDTLSVVFKVKHTDSDATIFWHINNEFHNNTKSFHENALRLPEGSYTLTLVDDKGNALKRRFRIISER